MIAATASIGCGKPSDSTDAAPQPVNVTVSTPKAPEAMVAARAEGGTWTTARGVETPLTFTAIDRYTVAIGCLATDQVVVYQVTVSELTTLVSDFVCNEVPGAFAKLSGTLTVSTSYPVIDIAWGANLAEVDTTTSPAMYSMTLPVGTRDLVAGALVRGPGGEYFSYVRVVHDLELASDMTLDLDLTTATKLAMGGDQSGPNNGTGNALITARQTTFYLSGSQYDIYSYLPEASLGADDRQKFRYAIATNTWAEHLARVPSRVASTAPSSAPVFSSDHVDWTSQPGAIAYAVRATGRTYFASSGVFDAGTTFLIPDLSGIPYWSFGGPPNRRDMMAIEGNASLEDALRLVPRNDTLYIVEPGFLP